MFVARVVGTVVATKKDDRLVGSKLLVVRPIDPAERPCGEARVAVDVVGAGIGETVLVVVGGSARRAVRQPDSPVDAAIVGIVDVMEAEADEGVHEVGRQG